MSQKITLEEIRNIAESKQGKLISTEYNGVQYKLKWVCKKGHQFERALHDVKYIGYWCLRCSGHHHEEDYIAWANKINATFIGVRRVGVKKRLLLKCSKNHEWLAHSGHLKLGHGCPECAGLKRLTIGHCQELAAKRGGVCLSTEYKNTSTKLHWKCGQGHEWHAKFSSLRRLDSWCPTCADIKLRKWTMQDAIDKAKEKKGLFLSKVFIAASYPYDWSCINRHCFTMEFSAILKGRWCPKCKYKTEQRVREIFENLTGKLFPRRRPKELMGKNGRSLELDGYCEELKLAFEYDGEFHFIESSFHSSTLKQRKARDKLKDRLCIKNNIKLIRIAYNDNIEQKVIQELHEFNHERGYK